MRKSANWMAKNKSETDSPKRAKTSAKKCKNGRNKRKEVKICESDQGAVCRNNRKGGTASLRSHTCVKRNGVFGARFKGLSLCFFLYQTGNLIRIKTGLDTYLIRIQTRTRLSRYPPLMIILSTLGDKTITYLIFFPDELF